jgi:hypothetical protein
MRIPPQVLAPRVSAFAPQTELSTGVRPAEKISDWCSACSNTVTFPWVYGGYSCQAGTRTCQRNCRVVTIDGRRSTLCDFSTESCGQCSRADTFSW